MTIEEIAKEIKDILNHAQQADRNYTFTPLYKAVHTLYYKVQGTVMDRRREAGVRSP